MLDLLEKTDDRRTAEGRDWRRMRPWLFAAAAVVSLIVATVAILNAGDEGASDLDTVDDPAELDVIPPTPIDLGEVLSTAVETGDNSTMEAVFSPDLTLTIDGTPRPSGHDTLTTERWYELMPITMECEPSTGDGVTPCQFTREVLMLDDHDVVWEGEAVVTWVDGVITDAVITSNNLELYAPAFEPYLEWVSVAHPADFPLMVDAAGLVESDASAELHATYSAEYNALIADGSPALLDVGDAMATAIESGDNRGLEALFSPALVLTVDGQVVPEGHDLLTTDRWFELLPFALNCRGALPDGMSPCRFERTVVMLDDHDVVWTGEATLTWIGGVVIDVVIASDNVAEYGAAFAPYVEWLMATHPDDIGSMFSAAGFVETDESAELHARYSAEYNTTLD